MAELFTNNAGSSLAGAITAVATTLSVQTGDGAKFPALSGSDFFRATLLKKSTLEVEIVKVTARSVDAFTITRAQEGTTALALDASDLVELRATAAFYQSMLTDSDVQSGAYASSADTGTANNFILTLNPVPTAYGAYQRFSFVAANSCTGPSVVNVNSLGNVAIKKGAGLLPLEKDDIKAGALVIIEHDGSVFQLINSSLVPATQDGNNNFSGTNNFQDKDVIRPKIKDYSITHTAPSISSGAVTFDLEKGDSFAVSLTENITAITLSNPAASGVYCEMVIEFKQDATGSRTIAGWPSSVKWIGGSAPAMTSTAGTGTDKVFLSTRDGGTTWYGEYSQDYS